MIRNITALSLFFTRSLLREKANYLLAFFAFLSAALSMALSDTNIAVKYKLFEDLLLTTQSSLLLLGGLFYAYTLLQKEKSAGLHVLPLASGITRFEYQMAIFKAPIISVFVLFLFFTLIDLLMLPLAQSAIKTALFVQLFLYFLSVAFLIALIIFFSRFVSVMNASLYGVILFFIGNALDELLVYANTLDNTVLLNIGKIFYIILPNFSLFDYQSSVVNGAGLNYTDIGITIVYGISYICVLALAASWKFKNKALSVSS